MAGNSIGEVFRVMTWGESHGAAIGAVIDGCPANIDLAENDIQKELDRRRPGRGVHETERVEDDRVEILSGVFRSRTTGTPISLLIRNRDMRSRDYESIKNVLRPGHGDFTYQKKYGIRDYRGGGRASGRETAARVAAGAVARKIIAPMSIEIIAYTKELGGIVANVSDLEGVADNQLLCPDADATKKMIKKLDAAVRKGDTLGGIVEVVVKGCPAGLGEPVFDKMDADLAKALMGIGTVKGVEIGAGFEAARMKGSVCNDPIVPGGFLTNNAGGILAGITSGEDIVIRVACKPIPSVSLPQQTVDEQGRPVSITVTGRHDVCVIPRIVPVCEAMTAIVLADHLLRQRAIS